MATATTAITTSTTTTTSSAPPFSPRGWHVEMNDSSISLHLNTGNQGEMHPQPLSQDKRIVTVRVVQAECAPILLPAALPPVVAWSMGRRKPTPKMTYFTTTTCPASVAVLPPPPKRQAPMEASIVLPPIQMPTAIPTTTTLLQPFYLPTQSKPIKAAVMTTKKPTAASATKANQPDSNKPPPTRQRKIKETPKDSNHVVVVSVKTRSKPNEQRQSMPRPCSFEAGHVKMRVVPPKRKKMKRS